VKKGRTYGDQRYKSEPSFHGPVLRIGSRRRNPRSGPTFLLRPALVGALIGLLLIPSSLGDSPASLASEHATPAPPRSAIGSLSRECLASPSCGPARVAGPPPSNALYVNPQTWTDITGEAGAAPPARWLGAMVYDPIDHYVLLFGGYGPGGNYGDTWTFSNNQWTQLSIPGPPPRYAASIAWDAKDGYAVLFGGYDSATDVYYNDTWTFVHGTWTNITGMTNQTPDARWRAAMTYDAGDGYVVMFGGTNAAETPYSDTWKFVGGNWTKLNVTGNPPARYRASMVYDPAENYSVLFGGCTSTCPDSTTWAYHNLTWTSLSPTTHPSARVYYGITYSPIAGSLLLFGGSSSATIDDPLSDTWNFTNGNWTEITSSLPRAPSAVAYLMMAFDPVDGYTIMYGGEWANATWSNRTWALGPSILGELTLQPGTIDLNQGTTVNATPFAFSKFVSYDYVTLPPGCTAGNVSTFDCSPNATGSYPIVATLNDSLGVPRTENASLTVNVDPQVSSFTVDHPSVTVDSPTNFTTVVTGGTPPFSYQYSGLPPGCGTRNNATLRCVPGGSSTGAYTVDVEAIDAAGYGVFSNVTLTVNPKPTVTSLVGYPSTLDVGQLLSLRATVAGGTAPISYVYSGLPDGCASADVPVLNCTPSGPSSGSVQLNATDAFGWTAGASTTITVNPDPTIRATAAAPSVFDLGSTVRLWVNATGGTGPLSYRYVNPPTGCTPAATAATSCTPAVAGEFNLSVEVTDSVGFSVNGTITFTVNPSLALPALTLASSAIDVNQNLSISAIPLGGTTPFSYRFTGLPTGCIPPTPDNGSFVCQPTRAQVSDISVTVTDAVGQFISASATLTVHPDPAIFGFTGSPNPVSVGTALELLVNASGGSGVFSFSYSQLPAGCVSENRSTLTCAPSAIGTFVVEVTMTDSLGYRTTAVTNVTVVSAASTSTILGLSSGTFYGVLVAAVVLLVLVGVAVLLLRRRRGRPTSEPDPVPPGEDPTAPP
jgi:Galactose oxidase, central domain